MTDGSRDIDLVNELLRNEESEWLEFKKGSEDPEMIGKLCSALSNGARLVDRDKGYVVWGVDDATRQIVGASFDPETKKKGNQSLHPWLLSMLNPRPSVEFRKIAHPQGDVVLLEVSAAVDVPTAYRGTAYVRIGSATQELQSNIQLHKKLNIHLGELNWEEAAAKEHLEQGEVLDLLGWEKYFEYMKEPKPETATEICERLGAEKLIRKNDAGKWDVTKLGAILFARKLSKFGASMERNGIRLAIYNGRDKPSGVKDKMDGERGYVLDFNSILERINLYNPVREEIGYPRRKDIPRFPKPAIRELLVNALIHQDFRITGAGPLVHVFGDKLEIDNPGASLVPSNRMIDFPPRTRNNVLGNLMRRMDFCEERGSGLDMVIKEIESYKFPPPEFRINDDSTQVILYGPRGFGDMTGMERLRACYQHAVIMYLGERKMTNATLRTRLGLPNSNSGITHASNIIKSALDNGLIRHFDRRHPRSGYVPNWSQTSNGI